MYGDSAPLKELEELLNKYEQFHLYIDDAHGMSSYGKNGAGYVLSKITLHSKMILATALGKAFGTIGGIFVVPDKELCDKIRNCAGPLIFSSQQSIPVLGASIASAKIHLSDEIYLMQKELAEKISHCHNLLEKYNLPDISDPETPVFFVALGSIKAGFSLVKKMMDDGYFLNLAIFPAVPETCTGIRFTITRHQSLTDIENMVIRLSVNFWKTLKDEQHSIENIAKAFKRITNLERFILAAKRDDQEKSAYNLLYANSITKIRAEEWNRIFDGDTPFDFNGLKFLEETFRNNTQQEHNCRFHYFIVYDSYNRPIIATFFTSTTIKDDMLSPSPVSMEIEMIRSSNPYYLTSKALIMGSILTTGDYLFLDRSNKNWRKAFVFLLNVVKDIAEKEDTNLLLLRDFKSTDQEISDFFLEQGFLKTAIPNNHTIKPRSFKNDEEFLGKLNHSQRQYVKNKAIRSESLFEIKILTECNKQEIETYKILFENVRRRNYEINTFGLPSKFLEKLNTHFNWEIIELKLKPNTTVAVMLCFQNNDKYFPLFVGMDYKYLNDYNIYAQILWQTIKRAIQLKCNIIQLGLTASQNKRKFGADTTPYVVYAQLRDNMNYNIISLMANRKRA